MDKMLNNIGKTLIDHGKDIIDNPSQIFNIGANLIGQEVLDTIIDKAMAEASEVITKEGLDPIPIPDITIPYSLDKLTGACAPFIKNKNSPLGELLLALCTCVAKNMNVEGDLFLKNGLLSGLSNLQRSKPTTVSMEDGKVKLEVDLGVNKLEAPFDASASIASPEFKPEVRAIVDRVGLRFGVEVPFTGQSKAGGNFDFSPPLDDLPVDVTMKLDELQELEEVVRPLIIAPVKEKLKEILREQFKKVVIDIVQKKIPGISALT